MTLFFQLLQLQILRCSSPVSMKRQIYAAHVKCIGFESVMIRTNYTNSLVLPIFIQDHLALREFWLSFGTGMSHKCMPVLPGSYIFPGWYVTSSLCFTGKILILNYGRDIPSLLLHALFCNRWTFNRIKYARSFWAWIGLLLAFSSSLMSIKMLIREEMGGESVWCPFSTHQIPKVGVIRNFPRFYPQYKFVGIIFRNLHVLKTCSWIIGIWFSLRQCLHFLNIIVFLFAYIYIYTVAWNLMKYSVIVIQIGELTCYHICWNDSLFDAS